MFQEHDCHEFLLVFLNNLKEELTSIGAKRPTDKVLKVEDLQKTFEKSFPSHVDKLFTIICD